jgi:AmpD protein
VLPNKTGVIDHLLNTARLVATTHCDLRPTASDISLLVIHNISLPPNQFDGHYVEAFFSGKLDPEQHPYFAQIHTMRVSAHCLIKRSGEVVQFVPFNQRAWHAGVSSFQGCSQCNDFSIGIELEGADHILYTARQYQVLAQVSRAIMEAYPKINPSRIVGHNDIAPGRKSDPGVSFHWTRYRQMLALY